jgi:heme exporter protein D
VHAVADQDHPPSLAGLARVVAVRVVVAVALVVVRMAQHRQLLQQKERQQASQQGREQAARVGLRFECLERLTMRSTILESSANEKMAAAEMLATPAKMVAARMEMRIGSI